MTIPELIAKWEREAEQCNCTTVGETQAETLTDCARELRAASGWSIDGCGMSMNELILRLTDVADVLDAGPEKQCASFLRVTAYRLRCNATPPPQS